MSEVLFVLENVREYLLQGSVEDAFGKSVLADVERLINDGHDAEAEYYKGVGVGLEVAERCIPQRHLLLLLENMGAMMGFMDPLKTHSDQEWADLRQAIAATDAAIRELKGEHSDEG